MDGCFFFNDTATTEIYTLSLHDALPIFEVAPQLIQIRRLAAARRGAVVTAVAVVACRFRRRGRRRGTVGIGALSIVVLVVATSPSRIIQVEHPAKALRQHRPAMGAL